MISLDNLKAIKTAKRAFIDALILYPEEATALGYPDPEKYWDHWRTREYQPVKDMADARTLEQIEAEALNNVVTAVTAKLDASEAEEDKSLYKAILSILKKEN